MNHFWWTLPGPARLVRTVLRDLRDGKNVLIALPAFAPAHLAAAVADQLNEESNLTFRAVDPAAWATDQHTRPLDFLIHKLVLSQVGARFWNSTILLEESVLHGQWFWIDPIQPAHWPAWHDFLAEYAHTCRSYPDHERPLFVLVTHAVDVNAAMIEDVCLSVYRWSGYVDRLDMLFLTKQLMADRGVSSKQTDEIKMTMAAELAQWDPEVAALLADQTLGTILQPHGILQMFAQRRGWDMSHCAEATWANGGINTMEDSAGTTHPALLALHDPTHELEARLWTAQVRVSFPHLETERRRLLNELASQLQLPFTNNGNTITELHDLELSHIAGQVNALPKRLINKKVRNKLNCLREVRNKLAHLELLTEELIRQMYYS